MTFQLLKNTPGSITSLNRSRKKSVPRALMFTACGYRGKQAQKHKHFFCSFFPCFIRSFPSLIEITQGTQLPTTLPQCGQLQAQLRLTQLIIWQDGDPRRGMHRCVNDASWQRELSMEKLRQHCRFPVLLLSAQLYTNLQRSLTAT